MATVEANRSFGETIDAENKQIPITMIGSSATEAEVRRESVTMGDTRSNESAAEIDTHGTGVATEIVGPDQIGGDATEYRFLERSLGSNVQQYSTGVHIILEYNLT